MPDKWMNWWRRWLVGWMDIFQGCAKVLTFGTIKIGWSIRLTNRMFRSWTRSH